MDTGNQGSTRKFPGYTLRELEGWLARHSEKDALYSEIKKEVEARKSGASKPFRVPQI